MERKKFLDNKKNGYMGNDGCLLYSALCRGRSRCNIRRSLRTDSPYGHRYHLGFTWMDSRFLGLKVLKPQEALVLSRIWQICGNFKEWTVSMGKSFLVQL